MHPSDELRFAASLGPLSKEDFWKKRILDAGCGEGKNSFWAVRWGAREVVGFDEDPVLVAKASQLLSQFGNARAGVGSLYDTSYEKEFDMLLALERVKMLAEPLRAVSSFARAVKPGALVVVTLPSKEGAPVLAQARFWLQPARNPLWTEEQVRSLFREELFREVHLFPSQEGRGWTAIAVAR